MPIAWP